MVKFPFKIAYAHQHQLMATWITVQEQSLFIQSYHITVTLDIPFLVLTLQGFVRATENGQELLPSVIKVCVLIQDQMCDNKAMIIG